MSASVSATAVRSSAKSESVASGCAAAMRRAGASRIESMPSMAKGSPCGMEPGEATGSECTSPPSSRKRSIPSHCSATL
eukprot:5599695-Alexandrium_andersonii.AAC.1